MKLFLLTNDMIFLWFGYKMFPKCLGFKGLIPMEPGFLECNWIKRALILLVDESTQAKHN